MLEEREVLSSHCKQLERRAETILTDYEQEKADKFAAKVHDCACSPMHALEPVLGMLLLTCTASGYYCIS